MTNPKIGTLNLNGARDSHKRMLYEFLKQKQIDVMFLQETHCTLKTNVLFSQQKNNATVCINLFEL